MARKAELQVEPKCTIHKLNYEAAKLTGYTYSTETITELVSLQILRALMVAKSISQIQHLQPLSHLSRCIKKRHCKMLSYYR